MTPDPPTQDERPARLYILARNYAEAREYADSHGIRPKDWTLMTKQSGRGIAHIRLARIPGWQFRRDREAVEYNLRAIAATGPILEVEP